MKIESISPSSENPKLRRKSPAEIASWALSLENVRPMLSTHFGPYEAVILNLIQGIKKDIDIVWVDSGYNTDRTYQLAHQLIREMNLNLHRYTPRVTVAYRKVNLGGIPTLGDQAEHDAFTQEVKLEPFERAMRELKPNLWITALRREQTVHRESLDILVQDREGLLKVSPFFYWTETQMKEYLQSHGLPDNEDYFDPTKVLGKRECGLHLNRKA